MRNIGAFLIFAIVISGAESLLAQDKAVPVPEKAISSPKTPPTNPEIKKLQKQVKILQGLVNELKGKVDKNTKDFSALMALVKANSGQIGQLTGVVTKNTNQIANHENAIGAIDKKVSDNDEKLRQIVVWDPVTREAYLDVLGNMSKPGFKKAFRQIVRFRLVLNNQTPDVRHLSINGVHWKVPRGISSIPVKHGNVLVRHLAGGPGSPFILLPEKDWEFDESKNAWIIKHDFQ